MGTSPYTILTLRHPRNHRDPWLKNNERTRTKVDCLIAGPEHRVLCTLNVVDRFIILALATVIFGTGCRATFDSKGNLKTPLSDLPSAPVQALDAEQVAFVRERSFQLWQPDHPEKGKTTTLVSQAAFVSPDGYALTAAHAVEPKPGFTFHRKVPPYEILRVTSIDSEGLHHFQLDGQEELLDKAQLRPVRVVKKFDGTDLALIRTTTPAPAHFEMVPEPPKEGDRLAYGFNPVIHPELPGLEGVVSKVNHTEPHWKMDCEGLAIFGDSGGSVVNEDGHLVGNITGATVSLFSWGKAKRVLGIEVEGVSSGAVTRAIEDDRRKLESKADHSTSNAR